MMVFLDDERRWTSKIAILVTGTSPSLIKQSFALVAHPSSSKQVQAVCLRATHSFPFEGTVVVSTKLQIGQVRRKIGFLVVPEMEINIILETIFDEKYIEGISTKTDLITPSEFSPLAIIDGSRRDHKMTVSVENLIAEGWTSTNEHLGVISRLANLPLMSKTVAQAWVPAKASN